MPDSLPPRDVAGANIQDFSVTFGTALLIPARIEACASAPTGTRLNFVLPALYDEWLYGGIPTAIRFFERLAKEFQYVRMIFPNQSESQFNFDAWPGWVVDHGEVEPRSIAFLGNGTTPLTVSAADFFLATFWTTAVYVQDVIARQAELFPGLRRRFVYLIQDFEAAFYAWSPAYAYAKSTYHYGDTAIAVFNSQTLAAYFRDNQMKFPEQYTFEPMLHPRLRKKRAEVAGCTKERLILAYGRPQMPRNGFDLVVDALKIWATEFPSAREWSVISLGLQHADIPLGEGVVLKSKGKLSLEDYALELARCWTGLSFIFTPATGYTQLEIAEFGAWLITNSTENKDLSKLSRNIVSLDDPTPASVADRLAWCCSQYHVGSVAAMSDLGPVFHRGEDEFPCAPSVARSLLDGATMPPVALTGPDETSLAQRDAVLGSSD